MRPSAPSLRIASLVVAGTLTACFAGVPAAAALVTFDDLSDPAGIGTPIASPYAGFSWDNFDVLNVPAFAASSPGTGYEAALQSGSNVGFNAYGNAATISAAAPFSLLDGTFASAFWSTLQVTVTGSLGGTQVVSQTFDLGQNPASHIVFDPGFRNVDSVTFTATGVAPGQTTPPGTQFGVDDLNLVSSVPEPSGLALALAGMLTLGCSASLRRRPLS